MSGPGALLLAFGGGLISFLSPCTLPLLPGYLSYISGLGVEEVREGENWRTVLAAATLFVLGFALVFVAFGATASYIGSILLPQRVLLGRVAGVLIIAMALAMLGVFNIPMLYSERRFHLGGEWGMWSAFPIGIAFGFGWSPCIGPVLTSILALATQEGTAQRGALLLLVYALGLGVPFLLVAVFAGRMFESLAWFKRHFLAINRTGGAVLLFMGMALVLGRWVEMLTPVLNWYADLHLPIG
jgi:cytochrome c-type biogenesis protein